MTYHSEKKTYETKLSCEIDIWITNYTKVEFSTKNVFSVFADLENIFGAT